MRKPFPTDLSDAQWTRLRLCLPTPNAQGRPRIHSLRDVFDAIFYVLKSGCHWWLLHRLKKIWADGAYTEEKLASWCKEQGGWELEIVERSTSAHTEGFVVLPRRWIVERTLGWLMRNRRLSKDYERLVQTSETFIEVAMIRLILRRLGKRA